MTPPHKQNPRISVIMGAHNAEAFIQYSVDSILSQTISDFEFIIIDDGSTDNTFSLLSKYQDNRIKIIRNKENIGLSSSLNKGMDIAKGEFIARMDADDISYPTRFERQLAFMESNPDVGICGTWHKKVIEKNTVLIRPPCDDSTIRLMLVFDAVFLHSSIFMRRQLIEHHGLRYNAACLAAQDYELWVRCAPLTSFANIPEFHLLYNFHSENTSNRKRTEQIRVANLARRNILELFGLCPTDSEFYLHTSLINFQFNGDTFQLSTAGSWLSRLAHAIQINTNLPMSEILSELSPYWYGACGSLAHHGITTYKSFLSNSCAKHAGISLHMKLLIRCALLRSIPTTL